MRKAVPLLLILCLLLPAAHALGEAGEAVPVTDAAGLRAMAEAPGASYRLEADIDMDGEAWVPFAFTGTLDGNGHKIDGLRVTGTGADTRETLDGNYKVYETVFAGLFTVMEGATVRDLTLSNAVIDAECTGSCFIAGLAGYAANAEIYNVTVSGRFTLTALDGVNLGAGGLIGYMDSCTVEDCMLDTELIVADMNTETVCEEFAGGIYASGRGRIRSCTVKTRVWASAHGYVHNGGCIGMAFWVHRKDTYKQYLYNTVSDAEIIFFEDSPSKRSYADPYIGENLGSNCRLSGNKKAHFASVKVREFDTVLLPEAPYERR